MNLSRIKFLVFFFIAISFYIFTSISLQAETSYYENANYKKYLISMIQDGDFNIINQGLPEQDWLITETKFHPSFHTESSTPFLLISHLYENIILSPFMDRPSEFNYRLGFVILNLIFIIGTIYFLYHALLNLKITASILDILFFLTSTAFFYFSVFTANVLEVYSCFIISYLVYLLTQLESDNFHQNSFVPIGILIGFAVLFKPFNILYSLPFIVVILLKKKSKLFLLTSLLAPIVILFSIELFNRYLKYGQIENPLFKGVSYLMSYNLKNLLASFKGGYLSLSGLFAVNLSYFIGLCGCIVYIFKHKIFSFKNTYIYYAFSATALFGIYMIAPMFFLGNILEDHLPGRIFINTVPMLILGYCYLINNFSRRNKIILQVILLALHMIYMFSYIYINSQNTYSYPARFLVSPIFMLQNFQTFVNLCIENNLLYIKALLIVFVSSALTSLLLYMLWRHKKIQIAVNTFMGISFLGFIIMSWLNYTNHQSNISKLDQERFFENKSIVSGSEAYTLDYVLDAANAFLNAENDNKFLIRKRIASYFEALSSQIVTNDPKVKEYLREQNLQLSFWVRENEKKMRLQQ